MVCPLIWGPRELRPSLEREIMFKTLSLTQHGDTYGNGFQVQTLQTQSLNENKKLCLGLLINKEEERKNIALSSTNSHDDSAERQRTCKDGHVRWY